MSRQHSVSKEILEMVCAQASFATPQANFGDIAAAALSECVDVVKGYCFKLPSSKELAFSCYLSSVHVT